MAEEDKSIAEEVTGEIVRLEKILEELELKALLNGPNDSAGAILSINAGMVETTPTTGQT